MVHNVISKICELCSRTRRIERPLLLRSLSDLLYIDTNQSPAGVNWAVTEKNVFDKFSFMWQPMSAAH